MDIHHISSSSTSSGQAVVSVGSGGDCHPGILEAFLDKLEVEDEDNNDVIPKGKRMIRQLEGFSTEGQPTGQFGPVVVMISP